MSKHENNDPIDVEIAHEEIHPEAPPHPEIDPEMTSAIAIVVPEETEQRRAEAVAEALADEPVEPEPVEPEPVAPTAELAVVPVRLPDQVDDDAEGQEFEEDLAILRMLSNKIFRRAVAGGAHLPEPDTIELHTPDDLAELHEALGELDAARDGETDLDVRLAEWKAALAI
jgi:hypothetical protein